MAFLVRLLRPLVGLLFSAAAIGIQADDIPLAPGYGELPYELPLPGSYELPPLGRAADAEILTPAGETSTLHAQYQGQYVLLSFMYSNCSDVNGCPLSAYVFYKIKAAMQSDPLLAERLRLISLSFDPSHDSPEVMRLYGENFKYAGKLGEWRFLTTASEPKLAPILQDYRQEIQRHVSVTGDANTEYAHLLRVFLIDPQKRIRNIYSVGFLHPDLLLNDVRTLMLEETPLEQTTAVSAKLSVPGDDKQGYEAASYQTNAKALPERRGDALDLSALVRQPPLGLPDLPKDETPNKDTIQLGRQLFYDRRLSFNDTFSCAMCHVPEQGFSNNEMATAVGVEGRSVRRNSPTLYNIAYAPTLFHDGRESDLSAQIWGPLLAKNEMANPSIGYVIEKLKKIPAYQGQFEKVFEGRGITMQTLGDALAAYQRSLLSADSAFDRWYYAKDATAIDTSAQRGFKLFTGKAQCIACHSVNANNALFSDYQFHNTGLGYRASMGQGPKSHRMNIAPGIFIDIDQSVIDQVGEDAAPDLGRYEITQDPADRWKYRTPSLRNVALTAPYMHNGQFSTLREVVAFYNRGGDANPTLSPLIKPLGLNEEEIDDLVSFMHTLTGSNVDALVSDAFAVPVGDLTPDDPNWAHSMSQARHGEAIQ